MLNCRDAIASKNHPPLFIASYILYLTIISHFIIFYYDVFASFCVHDSFHFFTVLSAWQFWVHDSSKCMTVPKACAWQSGVHDSPKCMCMTVKCAWQSRVHDSQMCMTVKYAWQSNVHDSQMCMTVKCAWQANVHDSHRCMIKLKMTVTGHYIW